MLFKIINITFVLIIIPWNIVSNELIFDVSQKKVILSNDDLEPDFTIYGFRIRLKSLVLKITGPNQKVVLQKKTKIFGMWTWNKTGEFSYPSLFHYYTNIKNNEIDFLVKKI